MALVQPTRILQTGGLYVIDGLPAIPEVAELFPSTRRWHAGKLKPCGTPAAWRRHQRRGEPLDDRCRKARARFDAKRDRSTRDAVTARRPIAGSRPAITTRS